MAALLFLVTMATAFSYGYCGNYTVTEEAWFEVEVKDLDGPGLDYRGQFTVALFGEAAPVTVLNFVSITKGYKRGREELTPNMVKSAHMGQQLVLHYTVTHKDKLSYKNTPIHRIVPDFVIQMGDITAGDGTGGRSIYGERFNDEQFSLSHRAAGWVAMANHGPDSNGSQFYITLNKARWLDGSHVVFGKVIRGFDVVKTIGEVEADRFTAYPKKRVRVVDCGINEIEKKYDLEEDQLDSVDDV